MDTKGKHKIVLSDEVWSAAERAVLEERTLSEICEFVLKHYLELPEECKPKAL